jgi:hypothetical protein
MTMHDVAADTVVAVMLADGWHRVARGSLVISPVGFGPGADLGMPGFRFAEAAGSPYQPTMLAGPLKSIIAVRLVSPSRARLAGHDRRRDWRDADSTNTNSSGLLAASNQLEDRELPVAPGVQVRRDKNQDHRFTAGTRPRPEAH